MTSNLLLLLLGLLALPPHAHRSFISFFNELELRQGPGDRLSMITVPTLYSIEFGIKEGDKGKKCRLNELYDSGRLMQKQGWRYLCVRSVKLLFSGTYSLFEKVIASIMEIKWCNA
jgi:hypothetical protein